MDPGAMMKGRTKRSNVDEPACLWESMRYEIEKGLRAVQVHRHGAIYGPHSDDGGEVRHDDEEVHRHNDEEVHRHGAIHRHEWNARWRLAEHEFASHHFCSCHLCCCKNTKYNMQKYKKWNSASLTPVLLVSPASDASLAPFRRICKKYLRL